MPPASPNLPQSFDELRLLARQRLPDPVWDYLESGSGDNRSRKANRSVFDSLGLESRVLADVRGGHTRLELFGQALEHPVLLAPVAYQRLFHPDGEAATQAAADAQGSLAVLSSLASMPFEQIRNAGDRPGWFQLYWQGDRPRTLRLIERARAAGFSALVFTVDAPIKLASLTLPGEIRAVNLEPAPEQPVGASLVFDGWMAQAPTWSDLEWLRRQVPEPLLLKGVLHPEDAQRAVELGCDGLVISNHGGRVLDGAPVALQRLPLIKERLPQDFPLLVDGGIRNGRDVFKALALGARAVLVGRPYIWGLAAAGALGVALTIRMLRDELEMSMALTGCPCLSDIKPACLWENRAG